MMIIDAIFLYVAASVFLTIGVVMLGEVKLVDKLLFFLLGIATIAPSVIIAYLTYNTTLFGKYFELWSGFNLFIILLIILSQVIILGIALVKSLSFEVFSKYIYKTHIAYLICLAVLTVIVGLVAVL